MGIVPVQTTIVETWRAQDSNRLELTGEVDARALYLAFDGRDLVLHLNEEGDLIRFAGFDPRAPGMQAPVSEISLPWEGVTLSFDDLLARGVRYGDQVQDIYVINIGDGEVFIDDIAAPDAEKILRFGSGIDPETLRANLRLRRTAMASTCCSSPMAMRAMSCGWPVSILMMYWQVTTPLVVLNLPV